MSADGLGIDVTTAVARLRATLATEQEPRASGIGVSKRDLRTVLAEYDRRGAALEHAECMGIGEFRVTQWAYEQAVRVMNERGAELDRMRRESLAEVPGAVGAIGNTVLFAKVDRLTAQRDAVLALHRRADDGTFPPCCAECLYYDEDGEVRRATWPCPTARALGVES